MNGKRKGKKAKSPDLTEKDSKEPIDIKSEQPFKEPSGVPVSFKRPSDASNVDSTDAGVKKKARLSPPPIECPEPNCGKRYSHKNGLKYHQAHAHQNKSEAEEAKPAVSLLDLHVLYHEQVYKKVRLKSSSTKKYLRHTGRMNFKYKLKKLLQPHSSFEIVLFAHSVGISKIHNIGCNNEFPIRC